MDCLNQNYLNARGPYDYTFNFWNDYLGLSTLVTKSPGRGAPPQGPNAITESLKATLGLDDDCAACACAGGGGEGARLDYCCCRSRRRCPSASPPLPPVCAAPLELSERFSILAPPLRSALLGGVRLPPDLDPAGLGGTLAAFDLFGSERRARARTASRGKQEPRICVFCRNNGAPEEVYGSHVLKAPDGRVVCPILRAYTCPLCSANGDNAHTIKYCPLSKDQPAQRAIKGGRAVGGKRMKIF